MAKVWDKGGGSKLDPIIERYEVGVDYLLDGKLFKYELAASMAHAVMLNRIDILSEQELADVKREIQGFYARFGDEIELEIVDEDIHSKLENMLTEKLGDAGKKIHTGRSRNDQVAVIMRLFEKEQLIRIAELYSGFMGTLIEFIRREGKKVLPGYTHTKQAMLITVGTWGAAFIESALDNLDWLMNLLHLIDQNPLGTGSGFGIPLPLDRELTTELLGFKRVQNNPVYAQNSRGKLEALIVDGLWCVMHDFSRMARDLLMFNMDEFLFVEATASITTGSSIMPQKRNLDILELIRARSNLMLSYSQALKTLTTGLISGYHRDLQETKDPVFKAFGLAGDSIQAMHVVLDNIRFDEEQIKRKLTPGIFATDIAFKAVGEGMPFRDAYKYAASQIETITVDDATISKSIEERVSDGSPVTVDPDKYQHRLDNQAGQWLALSTEMTRIFDGLLKE